MQLRLALTLIAALLTPSSSAAAEPDPNFYIFLCFGQSNMEGGGPIDERDALADKRFRVMADFDVPGRNWTRGKWYDAVPPLTRRTRGISLVDSFGKAMIAGLPAHIRVGVVKVGVPGTRIELWDKDGFRDYLATAETWKVKLAEEYDGNPYAYLVDLARIAQKSGVIKGILLHQGESNADDEEWPKKVKKIYDNLQKDISFSSGTVPLLAGEVVNADQGGEKASANQIMKALPETVPNSYVISSAGLPCNPDHLHFTADGYRQLGRRYAERMLAVLGYKVRN